MNLTKEHIVIIIPRQILYRCLICSVLRTLISTLKGDHQYNLIVVGHLSQTFIQGPLRHRTHTTTTTTTIIHPILLHHRDTCPDKDKSLCPHLTVMVSCLAVGILDRICLRLVCTLLVLVINVEVGEEAIITEEVGTVVTLGKAMNWPNRHCHGRRTYRQGHKVQENPIELGVDIGEVMESMCS